MPTRSRRAAIEASLDRIRRVATCVTDRPVITTTTQPSSSPSVFRFVPAREAVPLRTADGARIGFSMEHEYVAAADGQGGFAVRTIADRYRVVDADEREVLAYHWHPIGVSPVTFPHVHLSGRLVPLDLGRGARSARLGEMHLPTGGAVSLAEVVRLLIAEFGVVPRRSDWEGILAEADR